MVNLWNSLLEQSYGEQGHTSLKLCRSLIFCQNTSTLKYFLNYVDQIYPGNPKRFSDATLILSPLGFYTKEIVTDEGWTLRLELVCINPPQETSDLEYVSEFFGGDVLKEANSFINCTLLLDWTNKDQSYWLEDIILCKAATEQTLQTINFSVMMINSDYSKKLEITTPSWSSSTADFLHQSLRTIALSLDVNLLSDLKTPSLASKCAIGMTLEGEEVKELLEFAYLENCNVIRGSDTINKILLVDGHFPVVQFLEDKQKLTAAYKQCIPTISKRENHLLNHNADEKEAHGKHEPRIALPQEKLSKLYILQKQRIHEKGKRILPAEQIFPESHHVNTSVINSNSAVSLHAVSTNLDDSTLESLVEGIVQRHQVA